MPPSTATELTGRLDRIRWRAEDDSCLIAALQSGEVVKGPGNLSPALHSGLAYRFHGRWETHVKYGEQFAFATYATVVPHDKRGVIAYLVALVDGVGPARAESLWSTYGAGAVQALREHPDEVAAKGLLPLEVALAGSQVLHDDSAFEATKIDLLALLAGRGFQTSLVLKECLRLWGARAPEIVRRNPYALMMRRIASCGFKRCDALYLALGHPAALLKRQTFCAAHWLRTDGGGHTWHKIQTLERVILDAVPDDADPLRALKLGERARVFAVRRVGPARWVAERGKAHNEQTVAEKVKELAAWTRQRKRFGWPPDWLRVRTTIPIGRQPR